MSGDTCVMYELVCEWSKEEAQRFVHFFPLTCKTDLFPVNTCCAWGTQVCVGDRSRAVKSSKRHWMYSAALPATKRCRRLIFMEPLRENVEKWSLDAEIRF